MTTTYYLANWKQHLSASDIEPWLDGLSASSAQIIIAPPAPLLYPLKALILKKELPYKIAAQTVSSYPEGAHTGLFGVAQIKDLVDYCLIGHSESRQAFAETDSDVAKKAKLLLSAGITPVVCLDLPYLDSQLAALKAETLETPQLLVAYEPLSSIGTGNPSSPSQANSVAFKVKSLLSPSVPVLYGGSVDPGNVASFVNKQYLDGVLVGTASLDPAVFSRLINHG